MLQQIGSLPLGEYEWYCIDQKCQTIVKWTSLVSGYNHPSLLKAVDNPSTKMLLAARPSMGVAPPVDYVESLQATLLSVSHDNICVVL